MNSKYLKVISLLTALAVPVNVHAGEVLLIPKFGYQQQDTAEITIGSNVITFDDGGDTSVLGFEGGYLFDFGLALTGEILLYQIDILNETAGPSRGEINIGAFTANATYHFNKDSTFQPLIGAGIGSQVASLENSNSNIDMVGYRVQGKLGFLVKFSEHVGMLLEYKRIYFHMEDEDNDDNVFKSSSDFIAAGLTIHL